eukprot:3936909-Pleurochrysis_carterae.AAC.2
MYLKIAKSFDKDDPILRSLPLMWARQFYTAHWYLSILTKSPASDATQHHQMDGWLMGIWDSELLISINMPDVLSLTYPSSHSTSTLCDV